MLLDRRRERGVFDRLIEDVRTGASRSVVLRGDIGIGKTALLDYAAAAATGCHIIRTAGVEAEKELAFAALHQICAPILEPLEHLPAPQRDALRTAFGIEAGSPPDRFVVGLAVLGLFAEIGHERPLVLLIDDAQWLDRASAQVLGFTARRLRAESVGMVLAVRDTEDHPVVPELAALAELRVTGLPDEDARTLLAAAHPGPVDGRVLDRIIAESQGNPLALLELPRGFTPAELAGGFGLLSTTALPRRIEESFRRQLATLSATTRQVLLVAAAEPVGDPVLVWRAADRLGVGVGAEPGAQREAAGFVEFGSRVIFRHPLLRSAIYRAATPEQRRAVHAALAQATDPVTDPDRRAWHRAQAAARPDEEVAAELEHSAGRAQARGGLAAAAAFLERAAELTPDPVRRGERTLAAAQATHQAGLTDAALRLLALADAGPLDPFARARAHLLRGRLAFTMNRGRETPALLLRAATELEPLDLRLARDTHLDALRAALFAAHLAEDTGLRDAAEAARVAPPPAGAARPPDVLLDGLAVRYTQGYRAATPLLKSAVSAFEGAELPREGALRWLWYAASTAADLFDDERHDAFTGRLLQLARETGVMSLLPLTLSMRIVRMAVTGDLVAAAPLLDELRAVTDGMEIEELPYAALVLACWRGDEHRAADLDARTIAASERRGEGFGLIAAGWMRALLANGRGRYADAVAAAQAATEPQEVGILTWSALLELVIGAAHTGQLDLAAAGVERLAGFTGAAGTHWALGLEALARALAEPGPSADTSYRVAIEHLGHTRIRPQLARAHLHYGEWLRRSNRRSDAREQLRAAHEAFTAMDMRGFAELAAGELAATGETVRRRTAATSTQLTAQESQIVRLVREGLSNPEIAGRLFISRRTVEWHLSRIFTKLGITSRRQLLR